MGKLELLDLYEQEIKNGKTNSESEPELDNIFDRLANFIINLDPDTLDDNQVQEVINIIEEVEDEEDLQEVVAQRKRKRAKKSSGTEKSYGRKWYRMNRQKVKRRKKKFMRSSEGRKRSRMKDRLARLGRTPTGRRKVSYNVAKREEDQK